MHRYETELGVAMSSKMAASWVARNSDPIFADYIGPNFKYRCAGGSKRWSKFATPFTDKATKSAIFYVFRPPNFWGRGPQIPDRIL